MQELAARGEFVIGCRQLVRYIFYMPCYGQAQCSPIKPGTGSVPTRRIGVGTIPLWLSESSPDPHFVIPAEAGIHNTIINRIRNDIPVVVRGITRP